MSQGDHLDAKLREASQLADEGRWAEAYAILREEEADHPEDPTLLCMLGVASEEVGVDSLAYEYFRRCIAQQPTQPEILVTAGTALARFDDPEAETALRLAALSAPELASARLHYGSYLLREGHFDLARAELEAARSLTPQDPAVSREMGVLQLLTGRPSEATDELEQSLSEDPDDASARLLFGLALLEAGRDSEAAEELHRAAAALENDPEAHLLAALACATQEWTDEAWDALARAEGAESRIDPELIREAEETIEAGAAAAGRFLREHLAPSVLHERLLERP